MENAETFRFLNVTDSVHTLANWDNPTQLKLWRYNLHYFDDLVACNVAVRSDWHRTLIARWVGENPPGFGTGWEPYPTSLRIVNWMKWSVAASARGESVLDTQALNSLATQTRWLRKKLEIHLLANHLWANAKALVFAGSFFEDAEAQRWLDKGIAILQCELQEQILHDGGHFERSPMYHAILLEDVLDLINLAQVFPDCFRLSLLDQLYHVAPRMLYWLRVMTHPDGKISFFNDAAFGIAAEYSQLSEYACRLGIHVNEHQLAPIELLGDVGYVRLQNDRAVLLCDVAPIGPDHLPGHAHADSLSFELSLDGRRVLVNGGTSVYERGPERQRQRGTAAHNTVVVDGEDSSEVWGSFRVAKRAHPFDVTWGSEKGKLWLEAAHDGYKRLPGRVVHRRRWVLRSEGLDVEDRVEGRFETASLYLHLHPDVVPRVDERSGEGVVLEGNGRAHIRVSTDPLSKLRMADSTWHPEFGKTLENKTVTASFRGGSVVTRLRW